MSHPDVVTFKGRLGLQQRVLPIYRAAFYNQLAASCKGGLSVFAGLPRPDESITITDRLQEARYTPAENLHIGRGAAYICWQNGLLDWLKEWNPDALVVEANPRYLSTGQAVNWMRRCNRPVIGWGLGAPSLSGAAAGFRQMRRVQFLKRFDALIAYSQRGADEYAALGYPEQQIFVAPNAVAPRPSLSPPSRTLGVRTQPVVLFVGRLQPRKRVEILLQACAALPKAIQPRVLIVGDGPIRAELEALAARIYPEATFLGEKHGAEAKPYFEMADLFVLPGTGGLAVQEAMAYGLPVIVAKGDGTQDDLVRPQNGWQVPPDDLDLLFEALRTALSDLKRLRVMGAASYSIVANEINIEKMAEVFVGVLNGLI